jgi:SAM-dependent methyltransferase
MMPNDLAYVKKLLVGGTIRGPVLELGAGYGGSTTRAEIEGAGLEYKTTDMSAGPGVDYAADFEADNVASAIPRADFGSVLILNVLEHVFSPITVLDNAIRITRSGGTIVTITPSMWPVHNYPRDCQRLLPDWYVTFAERRETVRLIEPLFEFVGHGLVANYSKGQLRKLPPPWRSAASSLYTRGINKLFNTASRGQWAAPHIAIGAVFQKL